MKKVLALVVAFALCFTAFTGCFATSAAAALDNFAVSSVEVAADAQAATVTVSGTYTGKAVQLLSVTLPEGVALASVEGADELTDTQDGDYIVTGNVVKFLTVPNDAFTYKLNVTFAANTSETDAVAYEVVADVQYAFYDAENPTIETANAKGTITVAAVKVEEPEHTCTWGELQYKVEDGNCVTYQECTAEDCDEVNVVATVVNGSFSHYPVFESGLVLKFAPKDQTIFKTYTDVYAYFVKDNYAVSADGSVAAAASTADVVAENNGTRDEFIFNGIFSYDMCNNINIKVFGTDANGNKVLVLTEDYSMKAYIDTAYASYVKNNNKVKADFVCDLASYGAASQLHFKRNIENLPTAGLDLENYGTDDLAVSDFEIAETVANGNVIQSGEFTFNRAAVFEDKISLNIRFPKENCSEGAYLKIDFVDYANRADSVIYTADTFKTNPGNAAQYLVNFSDLRAIELHGKYDISLCAADGSTIATCAYSYDTYAWQATNSGSTAQTMKDLANRVVCYGRSTRKYFDYN